MVQISDIDATPSGSDDWSSDAPGFVTLSLTVPPQAFALVAERVGLVLAETVHGLTGQAAADFAARATLQLQKSLETKNAILSGLTSPGEPTGDE